MEIAVGGGDDTDVEGDGIVSADTADRALLQRPEQLRLQRRGQLGDLVEEAGAACGRLEQAPARAEGAGERAALVTEQLRLEERLRQGRAIDGDERPRGPRARLVNGARDELFAGPGLALDQHGGVERRHARDARVDLRHLVRLADEVVGPTTSERCVLVRGGRRRVPSRRERTPDDDLDLLHPERLREVVEGAGVHGFDRRVDGGEGRENDDGQVRLDRGQSFQHVEPVEPGHAQVHERQVEGLALREPHAFFAARHDRHAIALAPEGFAEQLAGHLVVVGDEE